MAAAELARARRGNDRLMQDLHALSTQQPEAVEVWAAPRLRFGALLISSC